MSAENFPVLELLPSLREHLAENHPVILQASPGAGKTTILPLQLLNEPWLRNKKIILLQPRRIAAFSACRHMASSLKEQPGETVGYRVRFESRCGPATRIEIVTEGIFLRLIKADPELRDVGLVILDEYHERNLETDLALALVLELRELREDLRLLIMSATLSGDSLSSLPGALSLTSAGRQFPVKILHRDDLPVLAADREQPVSYLDNGRIHPALYKALRLGIGHVFKNSSGNVLVFLPGVGEIRRLREELGDALPAEILTLSGSMSLAEQTSIFSSSEERRIILATNVAETSVTLPGITAVVDSGLARFSRFDSATGMEGIVIDEIADDSATQRSGRAGRLSEGLALRLWDRGSVRGRRRTTAPSILTSDLSGFFLDCLDLSVQPGEIFLPDPPPPAHLKRAGELLLQTSAAEKKQDRWLITSRGRRMAALPVSVRLSAMLIDFPCREAVMLAACLSQPIRPNTATADISVHLDSMRNSREFRNSCEQIHSLLPAESREAASFGVMLASAYPDRIGKRREEKGNYTLSGGGGGRLKKDDPLGDAEFLVAPILARRGGADAVIVAATPLEEKDLREKFSDRITAGTEMDSASSSGRIRMLRVERLGELVLSEKETGIADAADLSDEQFVNYLLQRIRRNGLPDFSPGTGNLARRILFLQARGVVLPSAREEDLMANLENWLSPFLTGIRHWRDVNSALLDAAFRSRYSRAQLAEVDALAPEIWESPIGNRIELLYKENDVELPVKLQELFGVAQTPAVMKGAVPVLLHLLSPARRPVQVTRDLSSFWNHAYHEVRKELRGRYPKHSWPEDPWSAQPVRK